MGGTSRKAFDIIRWIILIPISWLLYNYLLVGIVLLDLKVKESLNSYPTLHYFLLGIIMLLSTRIIVLSSVKIGPKKQRALNLLSIFYLIFFAYSYITKPYSKIDEGSVLFTIVFDVLIILNILFLHHYRK